MTRSMLDAAFPPSQPPKVGVVAFYIGGGTPHVWTAAELDATMRKAGAAAKLPVFVRVPPTTRAPTDDAGFVVRWLRAHGAPKGICHALDYETAIDATYLRAYDKVIVAAGYRTLLYGTLRTVIQNPRPSGGYWSAHWNNTPHICPATGVVATQYGGDVTIGQPWDISQVSDMVQLWGGQLEEDLMLDATDKQYLDAKFASISDQVGSGVRLILRGDATHPDHLDSVHTDTTAIRAKLDTGLTVTLDLSSATPEQLDQLASLIAGHVVAKGLALEGTVELHPAPVL
jgi:hypothetical protein